MSEEPRKRQGERNPSASIQQRIRNHARATGEDASLLLIRYINERFLYRLSISTFRDLFVLRGATLFSIWRREPHRATRDIDLLASGDNSPEAIRQLLTRVCEQVVEADGVTFLTETLKLEERTSERVYPGLHVEMLAALGTARPRLEIDIAFGEATLPAPQEETVSTLLDMPAPRLRAYQKETSIAEKCQAMAHLNLLNTRMKDFYDVWYLSRAFPFSGIILSDALRATFTRRNEPFPEAGLPVALTDVFARDTAKQQQWNSFVGKAALATNSATLPDVIARIRAFLQPPLAALAGGETFDLVWHPERGWHQEADQALPS